MNKNKTFLYTSYKILTETLKDTLRQKMNEWKNYFKQMETQRKQG